jgi:arsenite methyltransferase
MPAGSLTTKSRNQVVKAIGYNETDLESISKESILGVGCGAPPPLNFADIKEGESVVDLGSGAGIDVFPISQTGWSTRQGHRNRYDR